MESPTITPESEAALERYTSPLSTIEAAADLSAAQALDALLARDTLQTALADTPSY